jgi:hypothetical protein
MILRKLATLAFLVLSCHSAYSQSASHGGGMHVNRPPESRPDPTLIGDVVGRELGQPITALLGHVGMWDGENVVEALSTPDNAVNYNTLANFKSQTVYWGSVSPNIPNYTVYNCFDKYCANVLTAPNGPIQSVSTRVALAKFAKQQYIIGADYTTSRDYSAASPADTMLKARRGLYRCDTFVLGIYNSTIPYGNSHQNSYGPVDKTWEKRVLDVWTTFPSNLFLTLTAWI